MNLEDEVKREEEEDEDSRVKAAQSNNSSKHLREMKAGKSTDRMIKRARHASDVRRQRSPFLL